jgi:hypothetical protein
MVSRIDSVNCADATRLDAKAFCDKASEYHGVRYWRSLLHATERRSNGRAATAAFSGGYERNLERRQQPMQ